jgi:hypothetical protein
MQRSKKQEGWLLTRKNGKVIYRTTGPDRQRRTEQCRELRVLQLHADWLIGRHSTHNLPFRGPEFEYREEDSLPLLRPQKKAALSALYYEHTPEKDPLSMSSSSRSIKMSPNFTINSLAVIK